MIKDKILAVLASAGAALSAVFAALFFKEKSGREKDRRIQAETKAETLRKKEELRRENERIQERIQTETAGQVSQLHTGDNRSRFDAADRILRGITRNNQP